MPYATTQQAPRTHGPLWISLPTLLGAAATLMVPDVASTATAAATMLAVGALAMLAGHTWGLLVVVPAHLVLVGRLWPTFALHGPAQTQSALATGAIATVLVTALPALTLSAILMPKMVGNVLAGHSPRRQSMVVATVAVLLAAALVLPAV